MSKIKIILNGEDYHLKNEQFISDLIEELGLDVEKIAIERNLEIVTNDLFAKTPIKENDRIEIVSFIGGG